MVLAFCGARDAPAHALIFPASAFVFPSCTMAVEMESTLPMNPLGKGPAVNIPKAPPVPALKHTEFDPDRSIESYGLLDLYSHDAFLTVLHTPRIYEAFANFLQSEHSSENLAFWSRAERFRQVSREMVELVSTVDKIHLQPGSPEEINVSHRSRTEAIQNVNSMTLSLEESSKGFNELQREVEMLMWRDSYPRFLKHHLAYNASRSLEWYPGKSYSFKGLGECFCLTDPHRPDNPIVFASDAFVQVTGYSISEIINHNCRFLQGRLSDKSTVARIRDSVREGRESTEVFLNYRQDGTPFWNLLLIAPLRNEEGQIVYFFGAQVDVSALFHKHNDLSAILSRHFALNDSPPISPRKSFFRRLSERTRIRPFNPLSPPTMGLEEDIVRPNYTIGQQVSSFRTAYSKYIITSPSGQIQFYSDAAKELFQSEIPSHQQIFPFLSKAFSNVDSRSMKGLQKAFGRGQATSARLTLSPPASPTETFDAELLGDDPRSRQSSNATACTTDSNGTSSRALSLDPVVAVHMTPVKNELGKASMFVFILATGI